MARKRTVPIQAAKKPTSRTVSCISVLISIAVIACCISQIGKVFGSDSSGDATPTAHVASNSGGNNSAPTATPTEVPTATETPIPTDTPVPCKYQAIAGNSDCYNFQCCQLVYNADIGFCAYVECVSSFGDSKGYLVECGDGQFSTSGGLRGACSGHSGVKRKVYMP